jgi:2-keto-3-deoxy-L-rhamnonate aldolase RhmA
MPNGLEIAKAAIDDFKKIQRYMAIAKKENAVETYAELKEEYISLKAILNVAGVNLAELDKIKE